jgi:hypothetical protein
MNYLMDIKKWDTDDADFFENADFYGFISRNGEPRKSALEHPPYPRSNVSAKFFIIPQQPPE